MPTVQNRHSLWNYERAPQVAVAATALLNNVQFSGASGPHELSLRLGISDMAAWGAGSFFLIEHNGKELLTIDDQLADLLRPVSIPLELTGKDSIAISFFNASTGPVDASAVIRVDAA